MSCNHFEIEGKFFRIDTREAKGKVFENLVIEVDGTYPQFVPFRLWGRTVNESKDWRPGDVLLVKGKLGGRQWEGRVYGDNSADSVTVISGQREEPQGNPPAGPPPGDDDLPF